MEILHQLGELFLQAVPTVVVVFFFYLFLRWSFFLPIQRVLKERQARLEGARRESESLHARALEKQREHQDALRKARMAIFAEQEAVRSAALAERNAAVQQARSRAVEEVSHAKKRIADEIASARGELEASSQALAEQIAQAILEQRPLRSPVAEERQ